MLFVLGVSFNLREKRLVLANGGHISFFSWQILLSILLFAFVAGARYHTGYDHEMYLHQYISYQKYGFFTRDFEPLFMWVAQLMSDAHIHFFFFFALWALLQFFFCLYSCKHNMDLIPWICLNIVLGPFWMYLMNTIREGVVASLFLSMLPLITQRRFGLYTVIAIMAAFVHKTALLMIPFYFIGRIDVKPSKNVTIGLLIVFSAILFFGQNPAWMKSVLRLLVSFNCISNQYMSIVNPMMEGHFRTTNWGMISVLILALNVMTICFYPKLRSHFQNDKILPVAFVLFLAYCFCYYALVNTHYLFLRPFDLLMFAKILVYAYLALFFYEKRNWHMLGAFSLLNYSCIYLLIAKAIVIPNKVNQQILYSFFF